MLAAAYAGMPSPVVVGTWEDPEESVDVSADSEVDTVAMSIALSAEDAALVSVEGGVPSAVDVTISTLLGRLVGVRMSPSVVIGYSVVVKTAAEPSKLSVFATVLN